MNRYELKAWAKSKSKGFWWFIGGMSVFLVIAITCGIIAMYMSGYTFISWMAQFGWLVLIVAVIILIVILGIIYLKFREK